MPTIHSAVHPSLLSAALAASLSCVPMVRAHLAPPADPSTPPPAQRDGGGGNGGNDDVLRGPTVPEKGIESDRQFTGGKGGQRPAGALASKPALEQGAFFTAIDGMGFEGELKQSVDAARAEFLARLKAWEKTAGEERKKQFELRKKAAPNEPPSEEFKKKMAEIEASRPKLGELQQRVFAMLSEEQGAKLKDAFDAELKRVRDEIARKTEEDRKRAEETRKRKLQEKEQEKGAKKGVPSNGDKPQGGGKP